IRAGRTAVQETDHRHLLLRARREWRGQCYAGESCDELAASHAIPPSYADTARISKADERRAMTLCRPRGSRIHPIAQPPRRLRRYYHPIIGIVTHHSACTSNQSPWIGNDVRASGKLSADGVLDFGILPLCSKPCVSTPTGDDPFRMTTA